MPLQPRGYTLVEMMVALTVFALLTLAGQQVLTGVSRAVETRTAYAQQLTRLQQAMQLMQLDFTQMVPRAFPGRDDTRLPPLQSGPGVLDAKHPAIRFVRGGRANPHLSLPESHLLQVGYRVYNGMLERWTWPAVDGAKAQAPRVQQLMAVDEMTIAYYDGTRWQSTWPVSSERATLPQAIRIRLTLPSLGEVERIWLVTGPILPAGEGT